MNHELSPRIAIQSNLEISRGMTAENYSSASVGPQNAFKGNSFPNENLILNFHSMEEVKDGIVLRFDLWWVGCKTQVQITWYSPTDHWMMWDANHEDNPLIPYAFNRMRIGNYLFFKDGKYERGFRI